MIESMLLQQRQARRQCDTWHPFWVTIALPRAGSRKVPVRAIKSDSDLPASFTSPPEAFRLRYGIFYLTFSSICTQTPTFHHGNVSPVAGATSSCLVRDNLLTTFLQSQCFADFVKEMKGSPSDARRAVSPAARYHPCLLQPSVSKYLSIPLAWCHLFR
jgi:hypothetical protein